MNRNIENYKKALNELKVTDELKEKTLNNILNIDTVHEKTNTQEKTTNENLKTRPFNRFKVAIYSLTTVLASTVIVFSVLLVNNNSFLENMRGLYSKEDIAIEPIQEEDMLPKVGSIDNLNKILSGMEIKEISHVGELEKVVSTDSVMASTASSYKDYSKTNVQVEGIDEADIVKTDGNYIYYIANNKIYIVNVQIPQSMKVEKVLEYEEDTIPKELYVNDNKLVVILDKSQINSRYKNMDNRFVAEFDVLPYDTETLVITYDIRSKSDLLEKRKISMEGRYVDSRMINNEVYVVTTKTIYKDDEKNNLPQYMDTAIDNKKHDVSVEEMLYAPETKNNNYLMIIGFSLENEQPANIKTILGTGYQIYCTENNLYVINGESESHPVETAIPGIVSIARADIKYYTNIYKFKLQGTNVISTAVGKVDGRTVGDFSVSEYGNNFAIATTMDAWGENSTIIEKNTLYTLNENLEVIGTLENIADGENLYAVRFIGDKAFIVTFEQVDPLFVIDMSNPVEPKILGKLEIPGYSSYLQPYDEKHIIGIGQDVEVEQINYGTRNIIKGVKVSLFDVSDYANPKEVQSLIINDKSYTNVTYNYKALLFSKDKNILAFSMSSMVEGENKQEYIVLSIDLQDGISIKNKVDHGYEIAKYGKYMTIIDRGLYINNNLYTLSNKMIKVVNLDTFEQVGELAI